MERPDRRQFLTGVVPACALGCLGCSLAFGQEAAPPKPKAPPDTHPFDAPFDRPLSYRQFYGNRYRELIDLGKALESEMGKEKALEFLKCYTHDRMHRWGRLQAERAQDNGLSGYVEQFRAEEPYRNTLVKEIVEDSDKAFELKVTECMWASIFRNADAADLGFALVCYGDYGWAEGYNEKIELVRDKTLMEGESICNHRYVWKG